MKTFPGVDRSVRIERMAAWERCTGCSGGPQPGARALLAYWLESFDNVSSFGIYACRNVRGGQSMSVHACGRAVDMGVPVTGAGHISAYTFLRRIAPYAKTLGVCYIIFNREQWSATRNVNGEHYGGSHPHADHIHIELNGAAAQRLTLATLRSVVGDYRSESSEPEEPSEPSTPSDWRQEVIANMETIDLSGVTSSRSTWVRGDAVKRLQGLLMAHGVHPDGLTNSEGYPDGIGGPSTRSGVGRFQSNHRTGKPSSPSTPDYIVGKGTWSALNGV